ncbi:MAG: polyhydroxyalkanoate depolymerase [Bosea sp. (in: a-proteobacteria)]|jgi:poly(3-hydroxybutyrate) depolymerase|uniref:polyhydroxyalkanoate depolymerase n=1 Tax=Bosea sp. (in: a-proteobacteria) TaxID=1871050 RepID=UPI001DB97AF8|nr:polyhydroxyalkanoate depolymerase [Bosea sp. (in: a-proteobacteria)]MBA4270984.1 polyhydroxyalkanoate depolymerase [Methylobacterium sp.]MBX9873571.1 polyhydroxyalkanoate depolymerase [Beijerinckiaceae bacterium]MCZ8041563.1 polyhydroxyalkanoate depolymerase [Beijerinckiaceae bacterium]MDP3599941.1 polyhydroxyalkanoate depolymerase [Bosea sp. (in: a-proteobacteria)]
MLYLAYQAQSDLMNPARMLSQSALAAIGARAMSGQPMDWRATAAAYEMVTRAGLTHERPPYHIDSVREGNRDVPVTEEIVLSLPFGSLLRFRKDSEAPQAKVLVVAPMSGHFATLLRNTVATLLRDHDVYITDWHNARDVPLAAGPFGYDDYVDTLIRFVETLGSETHIVAVCQPCVQVLTAAAVMAQAGSPFQPRSMTLMAGPVDTRINPTAVNKLAMEKPIDWFGRNLIATVPSRYPGGGRKVYPGFVQLGAFVAMNLQRHVNAHIDMFLHLATGETEEAQKIKAFYDEYFAVLDLPAEFYLETVQWIFQEARLAARTLTYRGEPVDCRAIRRTALLTVEGERDDICALGQTSAAHDLCSGLKPFRKRHHMQAGVGHYGVFSGRKWDGQIYPIVRNMILANS